MEHSKSKQVEISNVDQWRGPLGQRDESDDFMSSISPFIKELDSSKVPELKINAEHCKWSWKQWEMKYVYQNIGDINQKMVCDIGGFLNPLIRVFAAKSGICHMYDLILPDRALISQLAYNNLIKYERQDVCSLACPDDTFNVVYSISTLEHVANKRLALSEMVRVTKPGGLVICTCDVFSHDADYQLEDSFFSNIPLNEGAIEDLLGISINFPNKSQCWDLWKKDSVYMSIPDRWPDWEFPFQREYTALGFVLRVNSDTSKKEKTNQNLGSLAIFQSAHSGCNHLVHGFYNVEQYGGRFTRKMARLRLTYDAEQHKYFYIKGYYPSLSRKANHLRIALDGISLPDVVLMERDQNIEYCVTVPTDLVSGTVFMDLEVENIVKPPGADVRLLGILVQECGFI
jgi:SAM-dependent methyltransferase